MADENNTLGGLLDPDSLKQLNAIVAQMGGISDDDKRQARTQAIINAGFSMLSARKGFEMPALAQAGLLGAQSYQADLKDLRAQRAANMTGAMQMLPLLRQLDWQKQMAGVNFGGQTPQQPAYNAGVPGAGQSHLAVATPDTRALMGMGGGTGAMFGPGTAGAPSDPAALGALGMQGGGAAPQMVSPPRAPSTGNRTVDYALQLGVSMPMIQMTKGPDDLLKILVDYGKPETGRAGGYRFVNGQIQHLPQAPQNSTVVFDGPGGAPRVVPLQGALPITMQNEGAAKAVNLSMEPQIGVDAQGGKSIVGNKLQALFGGSPLPYGVPSPYPQGNAPGPQEAPGQPPAAPVQVELPAQVEAFKKGQAANWTGYMKEIDDKAAASNDILGQVKYLRDISPYTKFGAFTPTQGKLAGMALDVPVVGKSIANMILPNADTNVPVLQDWNKQIVRMGSTATRALGANEAATVFEAQMKAQPGPAMTQKGSHMVLDSMEGAALAPLAKQQALHEWISNNPQGTPAGFEAYWNKNFPTSGFMPSPDQIERVLKGGEPLPTAAGKITTQAPAAPPAAPEVWATMKPDNRTNQATVLNEARAAIAEGKPRAAIIKRVQQMGFNAGAL